MTRGFELDVQGSDVNGLLSNWVCENKELIKSKKTFDSEYLNSIREAVLQALNEYILQMNRFEKLHSIFLLIF